MRTFLAPGRLLELIIVGVVLEGVALCAYRRRTGRGMRVPEVAAFLGAGLALLVAARSAVAPTASGAQTLAFAGAMAVALGCHVWHLAQRWDV